MCVSLSLKHLPLEILWVDTVCCSKHEFKDIVNENKQGFDG